MLSSCWSFSSLGLACKSFAMESVDEDEEEEDDDWAGSTSSDATFFALFVASIAGGVLSGSASEEFPFGSAPSLSLTSPLAIRACTVRNEFVLVVQPMILDDD